MTTIQRAYAALGDLGWIVRESDTLVANTQADAFFHLAATKAARWTALRTAFAGCRPRQLLLSANLGGFDCRIEGVHAATLEKGYFQPADHTEFQRRCERLHDAVVVINNNDLAEPVARQRFVEMVAACPNTVFVAWDWDNHHWLELSVFLAAHCDLYAPAHHENLHLLSRFNWLLAGPVYCASVQWPRALLGERSDAVLREDRSPAPLGMHIPYQPFQLRLKVLTTLAQHYPSIGFSSHGFHQRTAEDRLQEWTAHRLHWIVPVLNDVPIRLFDALITGGMPIVPESLRFLPPVAQIPTEHIVFYSPADVVSPQSLVDDANARFIGGGRAGMQARHDFALRAHHGDQRMQQILGYVDAALGVTAMDSQP